MILIQQFFRAVQSRIGEDHLMLSQSYLAERLVFLFLLALILFQYPLLSIVNFGLRIAGIPILFLYVFAVWGILIVLLLILMEFMGEEKADVAVSDE
jgi:hypothetical protein